MAPETTDTAGIAGIAAATPGRLVQNLVHFAHALRKAGVDVGPAQVANAVRAVHAAGFTRREDFYYALRATMVTRPDHLVVFHQVFAMFWRDPEFLERMIRMMSPLLEAAAGERARPEAGERRASDALAAEGAGRQDAPEREALETDARARWSANEVFRAMDFEQMSAAEMSQAARLLRDLVLPVPPLATRRMRPAARGRRPDWRAILRRSLRQGGEIAGLDRRAPLRRPPDLVAICDISGSMSVYSRMMMLFLHALARRAGPGWGRVSGFTFGTRLTNVTRHLRLRDADAALSALGHEAPDWQGGTRIGAALHAFNRDWSRRVLGRGATVLLISDGLERDDLALLAAEIERLALSSRRLIWLNPLLRWQDFAPLAGGIRTILPHVDAFRPCHNLESLASLAAALGDDGHRRTSSHLA